MSFKRSVIFPFLFVLFVVLNALFTNLEQIDHILAVRPLLVLLGAAAAGLTLLYLVLRDWHYAGYLVFLFLAFIFLFGHISYVLTNWLEMNTEPARLGLLAAWTVLIAFLSRRRLWKRLGGAARVTPGLNLFLALALLVQFVSLIPQLVQYGLLALRQVDTKQTIQAEENLQLDCSRRPDIYYIILDAYGRDDVVEQQYGADTRPFIEFLSEKGFVVAGESHSNYTQTIYSIASSLNLRYIDPEPPGISGAKYFSNLINDNLLIELLDQCGYETIAFETSFFITNHMHVDRQLAANPFDLNEIEGLLLSGTPLEMLAEETFKEPLVLSHAAHRERVKYAFEELQRLPAEPGPKFVFAHILSPHPPYVFDAQGLPTEPNHRFSINDGDDYHGSWGEYREGYAAQVQYVNRMLQQTIDAILTQSAEPPIIILQGDHGPGGWLDWDSPNETCLWERTSILNAYYLPGGQEMISQDITPVNSFRVVLNSTFATNLELQPNRFYFTSHRLPRQQIEITGREDSRENCAGKPTEPRR